MGLFSRKGKDDTDEPADLEPGVGEDLDDALGPDVTGRPVAVPLGDEERDRIASALEHAAAEGPDVVVETYAVAIGEHLARHSARDWAVVTDVFGTDLGLVAARADTVVVPHNLVGARWMRGETGWVPGVVSHLVRIRPRSR